MAESFNSTKFIEILGRLRPEKKGSLPEALSDAPTEMTEVDCERAKEILKKCKGGKTDFKSLESAISEYLDAVEL